MNKNKGFTLIELMTVIMIIAILATVVLVSLQAARERTRDVTIQNQIGQLRSLAEALYTFEDGYEDFTVSGHDNHSDYLLVKNKVNDMEGDLQHRFDGHEYCIYSKLVRQSDKAFCVDSTGNAVVGDFTSLSSSCDADTVCEGTTTATGCTVDADCPMGQSCEGGVCQ